MENFKVTISYLGFSFFGWAKQINAKPTIQETIENILEDILGEKIPIYCSGRTDKMVNAHEQVFSFKVNKLIIPINKFKDILNERLNSLNIYVIEIKKMQDNFHARFSAISKTYRYYINTDLKFNLFHSLFEYQLNKDLDINKLNEAIKLFEGEHDFLSFSTSELDNTIRKINFINILTNNKIIIIEINGNGFLKNMVRMIVGALINYSENKISLSKIKELLNKPKKGASNYIAPANGLTLFKVIY